MAKRFKTNYPGVFYIVSHPLGYSREEKIFYIRFRKDGKLVEEKAGRQFRDNMTAAKAARIRAAKIDGNLPTKNEERAKKREIKWTIGALWKAYVKAHPQLKSLRSDRSNYKLYIQPTFEHKRPVEISPFDTDKLRITLLKKKSPQTVKHVLSLLRRIIQYGVNAGLCQGLSFRITMPKVTNVKTEDLSSAQLVKLLKVLDSDHDIQVTNMMRLALYTGMRKGELLRLQWNHIDFEREFIRIVEPKGGKDQVIPLSSAARKILENHPKTDSSYVFPGRGGGPRKDMARGLNRIKKAADLPADFRPMHGLRHVFASILASSGQVDMYTLQKLLTHKSPQMTQRYAHLRDDALKKAADLTCDLVEKQLAAGSEKNIVNLGGIGGDDNKK